MQLKKSHWPLVIVAAVVLLIIAVQLALSLKRNQGHFVYALDDAYIHMAIARNLARYGVWGVTRYEFSSSTSSLLWTLILAAIYLFTSSPYVPLILNIICAIVAVVLADYVLRQSAMGTLRRLMLLLAFALLTPVVPLVFSGMEHTAHVISALGLAYFSAAFIAGDRPKKNYAGIVIFLAALTPLIRYEGLFLVAVVAALLAWKRRYATASLVVIVAVVPLALYGLFSWKHGSFLLPNPVLLKGSIPRSGVFPFLENAARVVLAAPHLLSLWLLAVFLLIAGRVDQRSRILLVIFALTAAIHILFARVGWFFRYEAYLIALGILVDGAALLEWIERRKRETVLPIVLVVLLAFVSAVFLLFRANKAITETVPAMQNIYEQHYQMATFLREHYQGASVAANDIGAINYFADIRCLDLLGLGSDEVTKAKLMGQYDSSRIDQLAQSHQVKIAMIYSGWYEKEGGVPPRWIKVGEWNIHDCVVCGAPVVSFFAVEPAEAEKLKRNLREFSGRLPSTIDQAGPYIDSNE